MGPFDDLTAAQRQQIRDAHAERKEAQMRKVTAADYASRTDRGECRVCGRSMQLKKDGTLRAHVHANMLGGSHLSPYGGHCRGSGQPPRED